MDITKMKSKIDIIDTADDAIRYFTSRLPHF